MRLARVFLRHLTAASRELAEHPDLEPLLTRLWSEVKAAWPEIDVPVAAFMRHLAERVTPGEQLAALSGVHAADLYLACACLRGGAKALSAFEEHFLPGISRYLSRSFAPSDSTDEVIQTLRTRLLVPGDGHTPKLALYNGRGPLAGWLRMVTARIVVDLHRAQKAVAARDSELPTLASAAPDPEIDYLKLRCRKELEDAFRSTLAALDTHSANVIRLHFLDGMTVEALAAMHRVSARTVHRWLADTRARVLDETRRLLAERLDLPASELDSLMDQAQSRLEVSVRRLLRRR